MSLMCWEQLRCVVSHVIRCFFRKLCLSLVNRVVYIRDDNILDHTTSAFTERFTDATTEFCEGFVVLVGSNVASTCI